MEAAPFPKRLVRPSRNGEPSGPQHVMGTLVGAGGAVMNPTFLSSSSSQSSPCYSVTNVCTEMSTGRRETPDP